MKNKQKLSANNGVSVSYKVEANERIKIPYFNEIMLTLLSIVACVGAIMTFVTILNFSVMPSVVIPFIAVFSIAYTVLYKLIEKRRYLVIAGAALLAVIIALLFLNDFTKGVTIIFDQSKVTICEFMGWDEPAVTFDWEDEFFSLTNFVIVLLSMVLCSAINYFTCVRQSFIAIFLLTFPFFEIGAAFGAVPNYLYFSFMLASWAATLTISRVANSKIKMRRSNGEKQNKSIDGSRQKFAGIAVVVAMVVVLLFTSIATYLHSIDFTRAENVDALRSSTKHAFDDFVDLVSGNDRDGSLKEGKLYKVDDRIVKNRHYITMQTNIASIKEPLKIRGYTATVYGDNEWGQIDNYDSYKAMFDSFNESSYKMGVETGAVLTTQINFGELLFANITMSDFRRKKPYAYEVYYSDLGEGFTPIYDSGVAPKKKSKYSYTSYISTKYIYEVTKTTLYSDDNYKAALAEYGEFVKKEYVNSQIPLSVKNLASSFKAKDQYDYLNQIRFYLKDNIKHTGKVDKCPSDADFVENFLFTTKKGYSTHFATAAAVLMQAKGYPARYVEGYHISTNTFNKAPSKHELGYKTVDITDKYAHAWIEIYDEAYGWVAVDVTPGYWTSSLEGPRPQGSEDVNMEGIGGDQVDLEPEEEKKPEPEPENTIIPSLDSQVDEGFNIVDKEVSTKLEWTSKDTKTLLEILFYLLLVLVAAVIAAYIVHLCLAHKKKRIYASSDVNEKMKFAYKYMTKLWAYQKVKVGNVYDYMALAEYLGDRIYYINEDRLKFIFNVFLSHAYSPEPASLDEANEVLGEIRSYSNAIYADLSKYEKLVYKYLLNLY